MLSSVLRSKRAVLVNVAIRELMVPKADVTRAPIGFVRHENE
jgi:hypothetical protein